MHEPIIGVSCNFKPDKSENGTFELDRSYTEAVYKSGGIPQIIPILPAEKIPSLLRLYDGILLSGGGGLLPHIKEMPVLPGLHEQNPERYEFETELIKHAIKMEIPMLGLCRGYQMINDVFGGTIANLPDKKHNQETPGDQPSHNVFIQPETILHNATKSDEIHVNSFHSQVIDKIGENLYVTAYAGDQSIEGIESTASNFLVGLQFHPEFMLEDENMMNIYQRFIGAAQAFKDKKT